MNTTTQVLKKENHTKMNQGDQIGRDGQQVTLNLTGVDLFYLCSQIYLSPVLI
jgi:hypothetical protein